MDDAALHQRLSRIERRVSVTLALVVGLYTIGSVTAVVWTIPSVTPWHGAVFVVGLGLIVGIMALVRRRRERA